MSKYALVFILSLTVSASSLADEKNSSKSALRKDFALMCEMSNLMANLKKSKAFEQDLPDLRERISAMLTKGLKTPEVKNAYKATSFVDKVSKVKLWKQTATDAGVNDWDCPSLGDW